MTGKHGALNASGIGEVEAAPDEAVVQFGVVNDAKTAAERRRRTPRVTQRVFDALSAQPNHGVTTTELCVNPLFSYDEHGVSSIVGFQATNRVSVKTKIGYVGKIYDVGVAAGATQSSGITFRIRNEAPFREEALRLAVDNAHREAKLVAHAAHIEITGIELIQIDPAGGSVFSRFDPDRFQCPGDTDHSRGPDDHCLRAGRVSHAAMTEASTALA